MVNNSDYLLNIHNGDEPLENCPLLLFLLKPRIVIVFITDETNSSTFRWMFERNPNTTVSTACSTCFDIKAQNFPFNVFLTKQINFLNTLKLSVCVLKTRCVFCDVSEMLSIIQASNG